MFLFNAYNSSDNLLAWYHFT